MMVIIKKKIEKGFFVHVQGHTFLSGRGVTLAEAIGNFILTHADVLEITLRWDEEDKLTRAHIGK